MLHTHDDFLNAIQAQPADRTLRLVYADWLDERADPRAELIRVEEQMRQLPVFADRFWELKPRRNELRTHAGPVWCGQMRYGTECEPVFRHGIPDGWRERWRLIREFTERWRILRWTGGYWERGPSFSDIGGRQAEIVEIEAGLGRTLPPSVREWIAFERDLFAAYDYWPDPEDAMTVELVPNQPAISFLGGRDEHDTRLGIWLADLDKTDPPVQLFDGDGTYPHGSTHPSVASHSATTSMSFRRVTGILEWRCGYLRHFIRDDEKRDELRQMLQQHFPVSVQWGGVSIFETDNAVITGVEASDDDELQLRVWISRHVDYQSLPTSFREYVEQIPPEHNQHLSVWQT